MLFKLHLHKNYFYLNTQIFRFPLLFLNFHEILEMRTDLYQNSPTNEFFALHETWKQFSWLLEGESKNVENWNSPEQQIATTENCLTKKYTTLEGFVICFAFSMLRSVVVETNVCV